MVFFAGHPTFQERDGLPDLRERRKPRNMSTDSSNTREHTLPIDNYRTSP